MKLHLELEGDVGGVLRALRRIGGGNYAGGEVRDGPHSPPTAGRTSAAGTLPEPGTTATAANLRPGRWTQELAADFTAGLDPVARRTMLHVWRAGAAGIHRSALCQRAELTRDRRAPFPSSRPDTLTKSGPFAEARGINSGPYGRHPGGDDRIAISIAATVRWRGLATNGRQLGSDFRNPARGNQGGGNRNRAGGDTPRTKRFT